MIDLGKLGELIKTRRSVRKFQDKPIPEDLLLKALELTNKGLITQMADAVKAKTELLASWPEAGQFGETVGRWRKTSDFFRGAPVCIAVLMSKYSSIADQILRARGESDPVAREIRSYRQLGNSTLQSIAAAMQEQLSHLRRIREELAELQRTAESLRVLGR